MTVSRHSAIALFLLLSAACRDSSSRAPVPTGFRWPETFAYRMDYVSETQRGGRSLLHYAESKTARFAIRDQQYLVAFDSVLKTGQSPGGPLRQLPYTPEDTLGFYVSLGRRGEISKLQLGCDPALPACAAALPSSVMLELRRVIPHLPEFEAPRGASWEDTLSFDDRSRPGGPVGTLLTRYTGRGDTVVGGREYWILVWSSARSARTRGRADAEAPRREDGLVLVDKQRLVPAFASWAGVAVAAPELRALGATATGYRGRAYLAGSAFDTLYAAQLNP